MTLALLLALACAGDDTGKGALPPATEWAGEPGMRYIFLRVLEEDAGSDTGAWDTGSRDTGSADTGTSDTGSADTGSSETGSSETGGSDTGSRDTGASDTGATDTGTGDTPAPSVDRERPLLLTALADRWILRQGEGGDDRWSRAAPFATWQLDRRDDFKVDEGTVIPERPVLDDKENGARVTEAGPVTVWYGTFEDAITVKVDEGYALEGVQAFARGFGPIRLTTSRGSWELAGWMRLTESELAAFEGDDDTGGSDTGQDTGGTDTGSGRDTSSAR
jgi:hypothetical protein